MAAELVEAKVRGKRRRRPARGARPAPGGSRHGGDGGGRRCEPRGRRSGAAPSPFYLRDCPAPASGPQPPPDLPRPNRTEPGRAVVPPALPGAAASPGFPRSLPRLRMAGAAPGPGPAARSGAVRRAGVGGGAGTGIARGWGSPEAPQGWGEGNHGSQLFARRFVPRFGPGGGSGRFSRSPPGSRL